MNENEEFEFRYRLEQEQAAQPQQQAQSAPSFMDTLGSAAKNVMTAPGRAIQNLTPEKISAVPEALPVAGSLIGGAFGGPLGSAAGAGLGQTASRMADIGYGRSPAPVTQPLVGPIQKPMVSEAYAPMAQAALGGLPETTAGKAVTGAIGRGFAKAGKTLAGVPEDVLKQATKQGYSTYAAPSMGKAKQIFGEALGPEGRAAMEQNASQVFDPAIGQARATATEIGTKLESGESISAIEALKARQATDDIISATSVTDKSKRKALFKWRTKFDDVISSQSGPLKEASGLYRKSIVKDKLTNLTRLTKSGEPSAFLPLVLGAGGRSMEGIANTMVGTSPAIWGLGATTMGQIGKISPEIRRAAMAAFIDKFTTKDGQ